MLELSSACATLRVDADRGGRLASLRVFGEELLVTESADPLQWGCYPMAPWAGRTRYGRFGFAGREHQLPITLAPHAIHGTLWNRPWEIVDSTTLQLSLGADWPFPGYARQRYELTDASLKLTLSVHAREEAFPAVIGWHPWFRRELGRGGAAQLRFEARSMYEVDDEMIPTGGLQVPTGGPWDDCFCNISEEPSITWPGVLSLSLHSDLDHWVIYDRPAHALCVEPMSGPPNALNSGATRVTPGQPLAGTFALSWRRD